MKTGEPLLLRAEQVAEMLNLGRTTIFGMIARGELRAIKVGRARRVARTEVDRWLQDQGATVDGSSQQGIQNAA